MNKKKIVIFANSLDGNNWKYQLSDLNKQGVDVVKFYKYVSQESLEFLALNAVDLVIVQTRLYNSDFLINMLRKEYAPNTNTPILYTSMKRRDENTIFKFYKPSYFFNELEPEGITPMVKKILGL